MTQAEQRPPLEAGSPYELRVGLSQRTTEEELRAGVRSGDVGYLHSFTTGSAVDGPGIRVAAWTTQCMFRCQFCHNPDSASKYCPGKPMFSPPMLLLVTLRSNARFFALHCVVPALSSTLRGRPSWSSYTA